MSSRRALAMSGTHSITAEQRDDDGRGEDDEGLLGAVARAPDVRSGAAEEHEQDQDHRADEERGKVLMREVGAAERAPLREDGEGGEDGARDVERVAAARDGALHEHDQRDGDHQRIEDEIGTSRRGRSPPACAG